MKFIPLLILSLFALNQCGCGFNKKHPPITSADIVGKWVAVQDKTVTLDIRSDGRVKINNLPGDITGNQKPYTGIRYWVLKNYPNASEYGADLRLTMEKTDNGYLVFVFKDNGKVYIFYYVGDADENNRYYFEKVVS